MRGNSKVDLSNPEELKRDIRKALEDTDGSPKGASAKMGVSLPYFWDLLKEYGLTALPRQIRDERRNYFRLEPLDPEKQ